MTKENKSIEKWITKDNVIYKKCNYVYNSLSGVKIN